MSMDVGGSKGGIMSQINVTPLVDVMLVLLIIMMIVAPMLNQGVLLTLPMASHSKRMFEEAVRAGASAQDVASIVLVSAALRAKERKK